MSEFWEKVITLAQADALKAHLSHFASLHAHRCTKCGSMYTCRRVECSCLEMRFLECDDCMGASQWQA